MDIKGRNRRRVPRPGLDAPIREIVAKLSEKGYAKKNGNPTRNARFINFDLYNIISHYRMVERGILNYYSLANNYGNLAGRVHYILKYSCVLTIASKMRLYTKRKVFKKYGKNLSVKGNNDKIISYPTPSYKRPKFRKNVIKIYDDSFIDKLHYRLNRGRIDLKGPCMICDSMENIEIHHVKALRKGGTLIRKDFLSEMMSRYNRKQIPVCSKCHKLIHRGKYDGKAI